MQRLAAAVFLAGLALPAAAQEQAPFWRGKTVTIVVGTSAGGGFDAYARLVGRFIGKHIPGSPQVVVTNMPGAASNIMAGYVAGVAPKDGTFIGASLSTQPLAPVLEEPGTLRYDPGKLAWLGSANEDVNLCVVRKDSRVKKFADVRDIETLMGGSAETSQTGYLPVLLNNATGAKFKMVFGYPGSREIMLAMEKGEVQGQCGMGWASLQTQYAEFLRNDRVTLLVQERVKEHPDLARLGVPVAGDFALDAEKRKILEIVYAQEIFGRPYFVSAEAPADRIEALRRAFMDTLKGPELLAEARKIGLDISPITGPDVQAMLADIYASPEELKRGLREAVRAKR